MIPYLQRRSRGSGYLTMAQEPALDGISKMYAFWFPITAKTTSSPLAGGWIKEKLTENWRSNSSLLPSKTWRKVRCSFNFDFCAFGGSLLHSCLWFSSSSEKGMGLWFLTILLLRFALSFAAELGLLSVSQGSFQFMTFWELWGNAVFKLFPELS